MVLSFIQDKFTIFLQKTSFIMNKYGNHYEGKLLQSLNHYGLVEFESYQYLCLTK